MSENEKSQAYGQARSAFDALKMDERAAFLVESVVAMLAEGVGEAGRVVSEVIDEMAAGLDACCAEEEDSTAGDPDAPAGNAAGAGHPARATKRAPGKGSAKPGSRRNKGKEPAQE